MHNVHLLFFKTDESVIANHRVFLAHFMLPWNYAIPDWNTTMGCKFYLEQHDSNVTWNKQESNYRFTIL